MGKQDVLDILEKSKLPMTSKEIALQLQDDIVQIAKIITRLLKERNTEIKVIEIDRRLAMRFFGCKHKMRLFYI